MAVEDEEAMEIFKPRTDNRQYKRIVLQNSLEVLLVSDPDTDKCAAAMNVDIGSFSDPEGLEGLAHFLEHMLFYASEKYPLEDSYCKYITQNGGSTNAFTSWEHTNYYFDVNPDAFEEAMDRFAQFFIKPLMSPDATMREIKAVDSEHQKNLLSDVWRFSQLQKHLSSSTHPYSKFSTGSWETLEVRPRAKGQDTRQELLKFYDGNYSANLMHLVVYSKESLEIMESLVEPKFQDIPNTDRNPITFPGQPCTSEHLQILVKTVPIKEGHRLLFAWPITPSIRYYREGPCRYLGHLIGHEGEGSLFYVLKTFEHMQDVVGLLFKYINLLQQSGICEWIFNELAAVCETAFHYRDKTPPIDYVVDLALNMQFYPPKDWLAGSSLPSKFNPSIIQLILCELTPNNVRIFWESKNFEGQTELVEPWYGTAYSVEQITGAAIEQWIHVAPNEHLHLPAPNLFIPTDLSIKEGQEKVIYPILVKKSAYSRLWYKPDTMFSTPKAFVKIDFNCPWASHSPESDILSDIFTRLLADYLNEYAYYAQVAGLDYSIRHTDSGFGVTIFGFNHKLKLLLETVIEKIAKFTVKADRFYVIKETVLKDYENFKFQQPYQQAMYYCSLILLDQSWPWTEQVDVLPGLEADDLSKFVPMLLSRTFLECYVAGNIEANEAESMIKHIEDVLFQGSHPVCQPVFPSQHLTNRVVKLDKGRSYCYFANGLNPKDENSALVHYFQVHQDDFLANVKLELFALIAKQPAFHQLRSVEQLGYITVLMKRKYFGIHGVQFVIQSTVKAPGHLDQRVEAFLHMFSSKLREMTADEFRRNVDALVDVKLEKHKNLKEESKFYWQEIVDGTFKFDRKESEIAALRQLTQEELIDFFDEYIKIGAPRRKTLSTRVYSASHSSEYESDKSAVNQIQIDDIFSFRRSQPLYGSFKGGFGHMKL
ncbi:Insulin-degrading enzyme-like 1, peroxisomal [Dionaea muscipula]